MSSSGKTLPANIRRGILSFPGTVPESQNTVERLLAQDRTEHHCFYGRVGLHNHLSHHLLAAYDFGAPASLLQAIYDAEKQIQDPLFTVDPVKHVVERQDIQVTANNWKDFLQRREYYANYLDFFTEEVALRGVPDTLEIYVFSSEANDHHGKMLSRLVGGALHPLIQLGYAVEFGSDVMVAQALAQTAVTSDFYPEIFDLHPTQPPTQDRKSLIGILRSVYDSETMKPVMPYDPDALLSQRLRDAFGPGSARPSEIRRLSALWSVSNAPDDKELNERLEELFFLATLLFAGTGREGYKPRLDFFLMHVLNATLFLPSLFKALPSAESRALVLRAFLPTILAYLTIRGRPRVNALLLMSYSATPRPPNHALDSKNAQDAIGDVRAPEYVNPWPAIIADVLHAPDSHTIKATRALYYAAQRFGNTPAGQLPGALAEDGSEILTGIAQADGTIFIRAAGALMESLGWVTHGEKAGSWDRSALGWDDAWKNSN